MPKNWNDETRLEPYFATLLKSSHNMTTRFDIHPSIPYYTLWLVYLRVRWEIPRPYPMRPDLDHFDVLHSGYDIVVMGYHAPGLTRHFLLRHILRILQRKNCYQAVCSRKIMTLLARTTFTRTISNCHITQISLLLCIPCVQLKLSACYGWLNYLYHYHYRYPLSLLLLLLLNHYWTVHRPQAH